MDLAQGSAHSKHLGNASVAEITCLLDLYRVRSRIGDFPDSPVTKESTCNVGDTEGKDSILGLGGSPEEGNGYPLQHSCLKKPPRQKSLAGYSPWGLKESAMTEHTHSSRAEKEKWLCRGVRVRLLTLRTSWRHSQEKQSSFSEPPALSLREQESQGSLRCFLHYFLPQRFSGSSW